VKNGERERSDMGAPKHASTISIGVDPLIMACFHDGAIADQACDPQIK